VIILVLQAVLAAVSSLPRLAYVERRIADYACWRMVSLLPRSGAPSSRFCALRRALRRLTGSTVDDSH